MQCSSLPRLRQIEAVGFRSDLEDRVSVDPPAWCTAMGESALVLSAWLDAGKSATFVQLPGREYERAQVGVETAGPVVDAVVNSRQLIVNR